MDHNGILDRAEKNALSMKLLNATDILEGNLINNLMKIAKKGGVDWKYVRNSNTPIVLAHNIVDCANSYEGQIKSLDNFLDQLRFSENPQALLDKKD
jgi:hypothetical protein